MTQVLDIIGAQTKCCGWWEVLQQREVMGSITREWKYADNILLIFVIVLF